MKTQIESQNDANQNIVPGSLAASGAICLNLLRLILRRHAATNSDAIGWIMLKIWGRTNSTNVKKALWTAHELDLEFEQINLGGPFGGLQDPTYLARNPNGLVPLLEDGETVLWESNTITRYLAAVYGKGSLWIENPAKRAQAEKWMDWASASLAGNFSDVIRHLIRLPEAERDPAILVRGLEGLARSMKIADEALGMPRGSPAKISASETFRSDVLPMPGSSFRSSGLPCPVLKTGTTVSSSARPTRRPS